MRLACVFAALWLVASLTIVITLRFVDPPASMVMLLEPGPFSEIAYHWVDREQISSELARAAIAAEDQRFLAHAGIDFNALTDVIEEYRRGDGLRGASTITQQVAKNLLLTNERNAVRKIFEAWFAVLIDFIWSKERILEVYLNIAEFGPGVFGAEAAAQNYFDQHASEISATQAAVLVAVLPSPKRLDAANPSDFLRTRQREIIAQMRLLDERGHYLGLNWWSR